jgi:peptide/nickel transport system substrate-binding protein
VAAACLTLAGGGAAAQDLTIGARAEPTIDPHFLYLATNMAYAHHVFDPIVEKDSSSKWGPALAVSWRAIEPALWEFKLRPGVKFHDGSDFTAEDVKFSIERIPAIPNNPNPYTNNVRSIARIEIVDPLTIRFHTHGPNPVLPGQLGNVFVVSHKVARDATPADFRSGKATIGTGPYRFIRYEPAATVELDRYDAYWGEKPEWKKVTFRIISKDAARTAALLAGDVDVIDYVPVTDIEALSKNPRVEIFKKVSDRLIYLIFDMRREQTPFATDNAGQPLTRNPLRDLRVRQAMAMAIDREAMTTRVMEGLSVPAAQFAPAHILGHDPAITVEKPDLDRARRLLAEAGYPDGFGLTVHCSNDRYVNDHKICQAVGSMLSRIGLKMKVETMPANVFFSRASTNRNEFSFYLSGWGHSSSGDISAFLTGHMHSEDRTRGLGSLNGVGLLDPKLDALIDDAVAEMDDRARGPKLRATMAAIVAELPRIPLHAQLTVVAARKGIVYDARADEQTMAMSARSRR